MNAEAPWAEPVRIEPEFPVAPHRTRVRTPKAPVREREYCRHGVWYSEDCKGCQVDRLVASAKLAQRELRTYRKLMRRDATLQRQLNTVQSQLHSSEIRLNALVGR